jgi:protein phosphatase
LRGEGKTDIGRKRKLNEDSFFVENGAIGSLPNLYIIADGMGGHQAGEVASFEAIRAFKSYVMENTFEDGDILDFMISATKHANSEVLKKSTCDKQYFGMGTTLSSCVFDKGKLYIAHVGDSRVYKVSGSSITQLTADHTFVNDLVKKGEITSEEAREHPKRNLITRAIGVEEDVLIDGVLHTLMGNDKIILCSDGLTSMLTDQEILMHINSGGGLPDTLNQLIDSAKNKGGDDNISVILIEEER